MPQRNSLPTYVRVRAKGRSPGGLAVRLRFSMRRKNSFTYLAFLDCRGIAEIPRDEFLKAFDEERNAFITDYEDPRTGFTGEITVKVFDTVELQNALRAFEMFKGKLSFPDDYESRLRAALRRDQKPDDYEVEVRAIR